MHQLFKDFYELLEISINDLKKAMHGLPQEALDWIPGTAMNTLGVIAVHVAGSTRYWMGDILIKDDSHRDRDAEFRTQGIALVELNHRLEASLAYAKGVLEEMTLEDLDTMCVFPKDGREITKGWVICHVLEHVANHLGHAHITRQLWDQR